MEPIIKLENVNFWYDKGKPSEVWAVKDITLEINKGEYVSFFGPSGCGKSTLLYAISGIDIPQKGKVMINNRDITQFSKREIAFFRQLGVGIIFQQFNLIPSIDVLDNITLPMAFLGVSLKKREEEAIKLLKRFGIGDLVHRYPHELSGGQQQRVGIARALANDPPIIVADEPLGNLDSENAKRVLAFLKELNKKDKKTIIMVTHEAWSLRDCHRVFYMKDGEIIKTEIPRKQGSLIKSLSVYFNKELVPAEFTPHQLMARSLSHLLLRGFSTEEIKRLEFFMLQRFQNKISQNAFKEFLDKSFKDGGVGLWRQKAEKTADYIEEIIGKRREVQEIYGELEKNPESPLKEETQKIRGWLLAEYRGKISDFQILRLDEIIFERIKNIITPEHFLKITNLSKNKFGVGLSFRAAHQISEKMETLLKGETKIL